ncbi:MAG: HAD hydrolase-like protein [archaeon]
MDKNKIKLFMFDYDGTLRDSMNPNVKGAKPQAFAESIVEFHPELSDKKEDIKKIYLETSGLNRFIQLREVEKRLSDFDIYPIKEKNWSERFNHHVKEEEIPLFEDVNETIIELKERGYLVAVGSSVPQKYLEKILNYHSHLSVRFDLILGNQKWHKGESEVSNFIKGVPYIAYACGKFDLKPKQIAYVGDAKEDISHGNEAGVYTIGKYDERIPKTKTILEAEKPNLLIKDLSEILKLF